MIGLVIPFALGAVLRSRGYVAASCFGVTSLVNACAGFFQYFGRLRHAGCMPTWSGR
jgi:hypothetical protein